MYKRVSILGGGSWGLAIARLLNGNGAEVTVWEFNRDDLEKLTQHRTHPDKLPGIKLPPSVTFTGDLVSALDSPDLVVLAVPSQFLRSALDRHPAPLCPVVHLAKGIEKGSLLRMSEVIAQSWNIPAEQVAVLSGPSHAEEVSRDLPTAVVVAGESDEVVSNIQQRFSSQSFRVYKSNDLAGVELGGSLKNIIAISAGISGGLGMGDNTLGALITRGLAEITRLGVAMGAQSETFSGLSGLGDLITTCASRHSRNRFVGEQIGLGKTLSETLASMSMVAEGVETTRSGYQLAKQHKVEMPITQMVYHVLFEEKPAKTAVIELMGRELKSEIYR